MDQPGPPPLGENHLRTISVTLSLLDEAAGEFLAWAGGRAGESALYAERNTLAPGARRVIAAEAAAIRGALADLRDDLGLGRRERDAARDIAARCALLWESLCELDASRLRGYGEVPPTLAAYLEPRIAALIRRLDRIGDAARGRVEDADRGRDQAGGPPSPNGGPADGRPRMLPLTIDGADGTALALTDLVLDFNGTLATDGVLREGVTARLHALAQHVAVTVLTADTFGTAEAALARAPVRVARVETGQDKADAVARLGPQRVAIIGNGRNDAAMARLAALSIAVVGTEGAAAELLREADVVVADILDALDLLLDPLRLRATLRR
jgi:soluble P-type ATPase